jgi:hypothetical protein
MKKIDEGMRQKGPGTAEGLARRVRASWRHGRRSSAAREESRMLRQFLRDCRKTIRKTQGERV